MNIRYTLFIFFAGIFSYSHVHAAGIPAKAEDADQLGRALIDAASNFDDPQQKAKRMHSLLKRGADVNYINMNGWRPLQYLLHASHDTRCMQLLIDAKAQLSSGKHNYLEQAMAHKQHDDVQLLLKAKANPADCRPYDVAMYALHAPLDLLPTLLPHIQNGDECRQFMKAVPDFSEEGYALALRCGLEPVNDDDLPQYERWQRKADTAIRRAIPVAAVADIVKDYLYTEAKAKKSE